MGTTQKQGIRLPRRACRFKGRRGFVALGSLCPVTRWWGEPVVSGVPGLRPEKSCRFKSLGCWLGFLIARLWLTHWFWRTWVSSFLRSRGTDGPSMRKCKGPREVSQLQQGSCPATLGIKMALMPFTFHVVQVKGLWLGRRPGRMPVGESPWSVQECLGCPFLQGPSSRF